MQADEKVAERALDSFEGKIEDYDPRLKAVGYVRISRQEAGVQLHSISLNDQRERIEAYCKLKNLDLVGIYEDADVSGTIRIFRRPQGSMMMKRVLKGEVMHVVCLKIDRMFRDALDALETMRELDKQLVNLHLLDVGGSIMDTGTSMGRMMFHLMAAFAELEASMIRDRTIASLRWKQNKGELSGGVVPYGYEKYTDGEFRWIRRLGRNTLVEKVKKNPEEFERLAVLIDLRRTGYTHTEIARFLNEAGQFNRSEKPWNHAAVRQLCQRHHRRLKEGFLYDGTPIQAETDKRITAPFSPLQTPSEYQKHAEIRASVRRRQKKEASNPPSE